MSAKIPEITPPPVDVRTFGKEKQQFDDLDSFDRVDVRLRETAGNIALAFVVTFWLAALCLVIAVGYHFNDASIPGDRRWTVAIALTAALFTAPSAIILAVLGSTRRRRSEGADDSSDPKLPFSQIFDVLKKSDP